MTHPETRKPGWDRANAEDTKTDSGIVHEHATPDQAEFWADRIRTAHAASVEAIVQIGRELLEAKAKLPHGEWGRLTGETTREPMLPFSSRTAQMLMSIASHPVLSNPHHWCGFPASWRTLAELARLPADVLQKYVETGVITPEITRATAEDLNAEARVEQVRAGPRVESPPESPPESQPEPPPEPPPQAGDRDRAAREAQDAWERAEAARRTAHRARRREQADAFKATFSFGTWQIGKADFRLVAGCLHPDQQPADRKERYTKAFQVFKRLEKHIVDRGTA